MGHSVSSGRPGQEYATIDTVDGVKVIKETSGKARTSLPLRSFNSGTYIVVDQTGELAYIGIYNKNGLITRNIDFERDGEENAHAHDWTDVVTKKGKRSRGRKYPKKSDRNHKQGLTDADRALIEKAKRGAANGKYKLPAWL